MNLRRFRHRARVGAYAVGTIVATLIALVPLPGHAGFDVVRFDGIVGQTGVPDSIGDLRLAIGTKSVPYSVLRAQKVTGNPATGPEIFSALGPGPPPLRVEGRDATVARITDAKPGTRLTITGNLDAANAFLTLMDVEPAPSPSPAH